MRNWVWLCALVLCAQTGLQVVTFPSEVDDSDQPYGLYVPRSHTPDRPYPLIVMLHGGMSDHRTDLKRLLQKPTEDFIVITPHARGWMGFQGLAERDVYDAIADVKRRYSIDEDRVYLTGLGTGGGGAFHLALSRPDVWAAAAPVSAVLPSGLEPLIPNAASVRWKVFQGASDPLVKPEQTRAFVERLRAQGAAIDYVEYPRVRHNAWDLAYRDGAIFAWFAAHQRDRFPTRVRFVTNTYRNAASNWLRFVKFTPGSAAEADARFTARKRLEVTTRNVDALQFDLAGHPLSQGPGLVRIHVDGTMLQTSAARPVHLSRTAKGWTLRASAPKAGEKRAGLEGPISDILSGRHLYVYGTLDAASPEEIIRRKRQAEYAADWDRAKNNLLVSFEVKSDFDVTPKDRKTSHLVLFGNRLTNEVIAELALPMHLSPAAADYGLVYIAPTPEGRYVLVNSGLPWWTRVDAANLPAPFQILSRYGDFALFKGAGDRILVEGRFDRQWKLSPADREALGKTGVMTTQP